MSLWSFIPWRRKPLDDFADAIRGELSDMRVPAADERLLERIRGSRISGARVILPLDDVSRRRRPLIAFSAVAAAAAVVVLLGQLTRDSGRAPASTSHWFTGDVAFASAPQALRYPGARVNRAERMRPMALRYAWTLRDSAGKTTSSELHLTVTRDSLSGQPAWRLVSSRARLDGATELDSVWVSPATFAPLRQTIVETPYRSYERIVVWQRFSERGVEGEMKAYRDGALSAHRTFDRTLDSDSGPYVADAFAPLYHIGVALDSGWAGRAAVLGWAVRDDNVFVPVQMRVDGQDVVRTPAGAFPSWRLAVESSGRRRWYWVRKTDGLGVRILDSTDTRSGVREIVLRSETRPR